MAGRRVRSPVDDVLGSSGAIAAAFLTELVLRDSRYPRVGWGFIAHGRPGWALRLFAAAGPAVRRIIARCDADPLAEADARIGAMDTSRDRPGRELVTPRLRLRRWCAADEAPMAAINRDPEVTHYLNRPVDEQAVSTFFAVVTDHWDRHGFGFYAVESREPGQYGFSSTHTRRSRSTRSSTPSTGAPARICRAPSSAQPTGCRATPAR